MSNTIDAHFATASQDALALCNEGRYVEAHDKYKALIAGLCARYSQEELAKNASVACILADYARVCSLQAMYVEANSLFETASNVLRDMAGDHHPVTLRTISEWVRMKMDAGTITDANRASVLDLLDLQKDYPDDLAFTLHTVAHFSISRMAYTDALDKLAQARALCEASSLPTTRLHLLAEIEIACARAHMDLGQYKEAEMAFQRALKCIEASPFLTQDFSVAAPDHPLTARVYQGLGELYARLCRYPEAVAQLENAIRVRTHYLGGTHPDMASALGWAALAQCGNASFTAGATLSVRSADCITGTMSTPSAASVLLNRVAVLDALGEYPDALAGLEKAGAMAATHPHSLLAAQIALRTARMQRVLAKYPACRDTLLAVGTLLAEATSPLPEHVLFHLEQAMLFCNLSKFNESIASITSADGALASLGGPGLHPQLQSQLLACQTVIAYILNDYQAAATLADSTLGLLSTHRLSRHPDFAMAVHDRSRVQHARADYALARKGHEEALRILEDVLPAGHPLTATVSQSVGLVLSAGAGFAEAQERYCRVLQLRGTLFGPIHPAVADTLASLASLERIQGHAEEALALLEQSLSIRRSAYGTENHIEVAASMVQQGELLCAVCRFGEARESFVDAMGIQRRLLGDRKHTDIARSLLGIVSVQFAVGDYAAALPLVTEACEIRKSLVGVAHPDYANALQHHARVVFVQGAYAEALSLHEQAMAILEQCLGADHPDVASAAQHVGVSSQFVMGIPPIERFGKAEAMLQKALTIRKARFGDGHTSVAETLGCIGSLRRSQGKLDDARRLIEQSLALRRRTQRVHMDVARALLTLGNLLCQQAKHKEARLCYQEAMEMAENVLGKFEHPDIARILTGLAATQEAAGNLKDAQLLLERALQIQQKTLGYQHRETASSYHNLSLILRHQGQVAAAQKLCEQALQQLESRLGPDHPDVGRALNTLAEIVRAERNYGRAAELYARSLSIFERAMGARDIMFAEALNNLANVYSDWNKHNEAIPLYARAVDVQKDILGPGHKNVAISLRNLGINYQQLGQIAEAIKAYQEAVEILKAVQGKASADVRSLQQVIAYLRGDPVQEALSNAVQRIRSLKLRVPRLGRRKKHAQKVKLLNADPLPPSGPEDEDESDEGEQ